MLKLSSRLISRHLGCTLYCSMDACCSQVAGSRQEIVLETSTCNVVGSGDLLQAERGLIRGRLRPSQGDSTPSWYRKFRKERHFVRKKMVATLENQGYSTNEIESPLRNSEEGRFYTVQGELLYGLHPVSLALQSSHRKCHRLFVKLKDISMEDHDYNEGIKKILQLARQKDVTIQVVSKDVLRMLVPKEHRQHQGVCLDASPIGYHNTSMDDVRRLVSMKNADRPRLWLFLDRIVDTHNFGAVLRTAYYLGVDEIFTEAGKCASLNPNVSKASTGVLEFSRIREVENVMTFIETLKSNSSSSFVVIGTTHDATVVQRRSDSEVTFAHTATLDQDSLLILGNEGVGISVQLAPLCDRWLIVASTKQLSRGTDSLNVSVAAGILMFSLLKDRKPIQ